MRSGCAGNDIIYFAMPSKYRGIPAFFHLAVLLLHLLISIDGQNNIPLELLPFCDGPGETSEDVFTIVPSVSAIKRDSQMSSSYAAKIFRRFSGPFADNIPLPWSCEMAPIWRDLGDEYFPRFIRDGTCVNRTCWYRHYACQPVQYSLGVLQRQESECIDQSLPMELATSWKLRAVTVTSSCICGLA